MILGNTQEFASPDEALKHYGVKGMRWGVRKEEDTGARTAARVNADAKREMLKEITTSPSGRVTSAPKPNLIADPLSSKATPNSKDLDSAAKTQARVDSFLKRADVMDTKVSELKLLNKQLEGSRNPLKMYEKYGNNQTRKQFEKAKQNAVKDAEATKHGKMTTKQKQMMFGALAVGGILATGAIYGSVVKGQQSGALNSYRLLAEARLRGQKVPFNVNKDLTGPMSAKDLLTKVVKPVNPLYSTAGGQMNCRRSTYAYELRRRGFDVRATTSAVGWGQSESGVINALTPGSRNFYDRLSVSQAVVNTGGSTVARGDTRLRPIAKIVMDKLNTGGPDGMTSAWGSKKVFEELAKQPNGARGEVLLKFQQFGHSMAYEVVDGKPHIFDSQKGTYHDLTKTIEEKWGSFHGAEITRLDNAELDLGFLSRWAANSDSKTSPSAVETATKRLARIRDEARDLVVARTRGYNVTRT